MKTCPKCNMSLPDDAKFCPVCGCELQKKRRLRHIDAELTATEATIRKFKTTTISWTAKGAKNVKFDGEMLPCPGSKQVNPRGDHKYTVDFLDAKGELIESRSIIIEVLPNWNILLILIALWVIIGIIGAIVATNL